ncbi:bpX6 domain-containing protein [Kitasatospora sp. NPDC058190]|uniref:bpX6 domain-containing protein n=1 Tax=Kitasatospora sp. NPDC058190 TaxID=3346371 RepID=UPI0036DC0DD8
MSSPVTSPIDAAGFVLDVPVIGAAEAAERVLRYWQDGARLAELPDGRWLLALPEPVLTRADRSPGEPLRAVGGALVAAGAPEDAAVGELALTVGGVTCRHVIAELSALDPSDWLDLSGLTLHRLAPVGTPAVAEPVETDLRRAPVLDLRAAAGIPEPSQRAGRLLSERHRKAKAKAKATGPRPYWQLLVAGVFVGLLLYLALGSHDRFTDVPLVLPVGIGLLVGLSVIPCARTARSGRAEARRARAEARRARPEGAAAGRLTGRLTGRREWWSLFLSALLCLLLGLSGLVAGGFSAGLLLLTLLGACGVALSVLPRIPTVAGRARAAQDAQAKAVRAARERRAKAARAAREAHAAAGHGPGPAPARPRPPRRPRGQWLAELALRSPARALFQDRHVRYLEQLIRSFRRRHWEDALRDALPLSEGGSRQRLLTLRLPDRYAGELRPSPQQPGGTLLSSPVSGPTVHQLLTDLYREAAEALEQDGRIDEAAYVLADLLAAPAEAVALLDRHGRTTQAAELAEGRGLAAELVVRLWWRAGQRERAVRIAQRRGAFAAAVERLGATDPAAARELRAAWAEHRRRAGDRLGAVEAAWPDETLRPGLVGDLREALELGGAAHGRALVHLLALGEDAAEPARALLTADAPGSERAAALTALAELRCADPVLDRELATAAVRSFVRTDGLAGRREARGAGSVHARLLKRADPLVAADLARPRPVRPGGGPLLVTAADRVGTLPVLDAAYLDSGAVLVACGQAGVRLLGPDGRTRARWDVPADQLVLADHGGTALLAARYGEVRELFRLDLATRKVERWTALRVRRLVSSYDGRHLLTVDQDGIAVLDTLTARPTVVHRELGDDQRLLGRIARTPDSCAALVRTRIGYRTDELTELWRWDQPGWELRARTEVSPTDAVGAVALADGRMLASAPSGTPGRSVLRWSGSGKAEQTVPGRVVLAGDGAHWLFASSSEDGLRVTVGAATGAAFTAVVPGAAATPVGLRAHAGAITCWHRTGRVLAVSADGTDLLANLRVTVRS